MIYYIAEGFMLGLAYASPIGVQNVFVISNALQFGLPKSIILSVIVALMDISLAIACILGVGQFLEQFKILQGAVTIIGSAYLIFISVQLLNEIRTTVDIKINEINKIDWKLVSQKAFLLTWFNPHAILDGTAILGGYAGGLTHQNRIIFSVGAALASLAWFLSLAFIASIISKSGKSANYLKIIKAFSALTISFFAIKMLLNFWRQS